MFVRFGKMLTVFALICVVGGHWVFLQTFAWTTMLADNLRTDSISEAIQRTFDGEHPCCLCKQIAAGQQKEKKSGFILQLKKMEFASQNILVVFVAPQDFYLRPEISFSVRSVSDRPPVPPPRAA